MIICQIRDTEKKLEELRKTNESMRSQINEKRSTFERDQLAKKKLDCKHMELSIIIDELKNETIRLHNEITKIEQAKSKLVDLLRYVKGYTLVGDIRYRIKNLFVEDLDCSDNIANDQDDDDDIVWDSL